MADVADRLAEIRERVEAATEGPWFTKRTNKAFVTTIKAKKRTKGKLPTIGYAGSTANTVGPAADQRRRDAKFIAKSRSDVPYLLSLVEEQRVQLCKYTCECGPSANPDPEEHADYCLYRSALRDAAQEGEG